jgi:hypothetical protein
MSDFIRCDNYGIRKIVMFNRIWHAARQVPEAFLPVRYEDLHVAPREVLRCVLEFMGIAPTDDGLLNRAIEFASFHNMRRMEREGQLQSRKLRPGRPDDEESFKVRRGKVGGFVDYLDSDDRDFVGRVIRELDGPSITNEPPLPTPGQRLRGIAASEVYPRRRVRAFGGLESGAAGAIVKWDRISSRVGSSPSCSCG